MGLVRSLLRLAAVAAIVVALLVLAGCPLTNPTPDYRYRLTVEVETPEGLRTGSSVIEVQTAVAGSLSIPLPGGVSHRLRGEAVAVDLPGGRTLFALLRSESDVDWASRVMFMLAPEGPPEAEDSFLARYDNMLKLKGPITVPRMWPPIAHLPERSAYPRLVTFEDIRDPRSVREVDPDDLASTLGEGVALKRITVEMTEAPVTATILTLLPWLQNSRGAIVPKPGPGPLGELPIQYQLIDGDFIMGKMKT